MRRSLNFAVLCACVAAGIATSSVAYARGARHAAMVLDANTGAVLHNEDGDEQRHPASLTKMMTLYLTFETLETGRLKMSDKVTISERAASVAPSKLDLDPGEQITVSDAIRALITKSANDVAVALAERIGGSQDNFVKLMNTRARELGMGKTHFENASGLPDAEQVTTARDMITLALHLQDDFPAYYPLFATRAFTYNGHTHRNHNTMLNSFNGIDGIKTGYTSASGFNLVSSARRNGRHLIGVVFGGASAATRNGEMRVMLTRAFNRASSAKTRKPMPSLMAKLKSEPKLAARPLPKVAAEPREMAAALPPPPKPFAAVRPAPAAKSVAEAAAPPLAPLPKAAANKPVELAHAAPAPAPAPLAVAKLAPEREVAVSAAETAINQPQAAAAEAPAPSAAPLEVFKVKRVAVAPRQGPPAPKPRADETTDMPEPDAMPAAGLNAADEGTFKVASESDPAEAIADTFAGGAETVVPKTVTVAEAAPAARSTGTLPPATMLGAADLAAAQSTPAAPAAAASPTPASAAPQAAKRVIAPAALIAQPAAAKPRPALRPQAYEPPAQRGLPPSSLQAQAAALSGGAPQRMAALQPTSTAGASSAGSARYEIQIGAYGSIDEAQRALNAVQQKSGQLLAGAASVTHPANKDGRQMFRARFTGFTSQRATDTCNALRRQSVDCFVMSAE